MIECIIHPFSLSFLFLIIIVLLWLFRPFFRHMFTAFLHDMLPMLPPHDPMIPWSNYVLGQPLLDTTPLLKSFKAINGKTSPFTSSKTGCFGRYLRDSPRSSSIFCHPWVLIRTRRISNGHGGAAGGGCRGHLGSCRGSGSGPARLLWRGRGALCGGGGRVPEDGDEMMIS